MSHEHRFHFKMFISRVTNTTSYPALGTGEDFSVIFNCKNTEVGAGKKNLTDSLTMSNPASS